jgi:hypothetical protein
MPELYDDRIIEWQVHVAKNTGVYDAVIGRKLLTLDPRLNLQKISNLAGISKIKLTSFNVRAAAVTQPCQSTSKMMIPQRKKLRSLFSSTYSTSKVRSRQFAHFLKCSCAKVGRCALLLLVLVLHTLC